MWRALVWLNLYGCEAVRHKLKNRQKISFFVFLGCFWAYVRQPHNHIGYATPMPFASINPTNKRTNPWNFCEKILRIGRTGKWAFYLVGHFEFFFAKKIFLLLHSNENMSKFIGQQGFFEILMTTLFSSPKQNLPKNMQNSVYITNAFYFASHLEVENFAKRKKYLC